MDTESDPGMPDDVRKRLTEKVLEARSPLYRWLHDHHAEIASVLGARPAWEALSKLAAENGIVAPSGGKLSRQAVKQTWQRLERDIKAVTPQIPPPPPTPPPRPAVTTLPTPSPTGTPDVRRPDPGQRGFTWDAAKAAAEVERHFRTDDDERD